MRHKARIDIAIIITIPSIASGIITMAFHKHSSMKPAAQLWDTVAIASQPQNKMLLPHTQGAPVFHGPDVTTFLHKYESLAAFTATDVTESSIIAMFLYYCAEGFKVREMVIMMRSFQCRDWAAMKMEMLDVFRHADSWALIYTRQYLEQLCAEFGGREDTKSLTSFLHTFGHISAVVTEHRM
ncbi:hypothetical protein BDD12DRAFT_842974, partial [Trichophaea hybrida]